MIANYHTHTKYCKHGVGEIEDYIIEAINNNFEEIGFSEHVPVPGVLDGISRMDYDQFEEFNDELDRLIIKYQDQISIIKGFECEYLLENFDLYDEYKNKYNYQYFILGHHWNARKDTFYGAVTSEDELDEYADSMIAGIKSKKFKILAHIDFVGKAYKGDLNKLVEIAHRIFQVCEEADMIVEFNANGYRSPKNLHLQNSLGQPYPIEAMWEVAKAYNLRVIIGSDCHNPAYLNDEHVAFATDYVKSLGLTLIEKLDI